MICKSLILGILFSIGIFAIKSGLGLHYYLSKTPSGKRRAMVLALFFLAYLSLFILSQQLLARIDLVRHMNTIQTFIQSGMLIHLVMAGLLTLWGLHLLRHSQHNFQGEPTPNLQSDSDNNFQGEYTNKRHTRAWLMLVIPCPVCVTVIFISLGFMTACFPDTPMLTMLLLFFCFLLINGLTLFIMGAGKWNRNSSPEALLGSAMLLISAYFLLSVTIMPQFADADKVYRLSLSTSEIPFQQIQHLFLFIACVGMTFISGFTYTYLHIWRKP
ncbi:DUF2162 family putative transporter [Desulfamplus magnetovallimortis]|uniref:DUF2162 family putative transporter n=1 Tax=Desulfamplus magnetovallimortis TaxID=1246637 RepID=UPI0009B96641|nr:DUF2162 family putative transporter [Desulfamplus magnetovallimortis]